MNKVEKDLFALKDQSYCNLQSKIVPNIKPENIIGVRIPILRNYAKGMNNDDISSFINDLPHNYYDENILHSILLSNIKDYDSLINYINNFLPYVDNWAVCDTLIPKIFKKNKEKLKKEINTWLKSSHTYTIRFGIKVLMTFYLDEDFDIKYLDEVSKIKSNEYYVNMMISWYFATSLAKKYKETIIFLENNKLDKWVHNKTIQKACESFRITEEEKKYLKSLRK